MREITGKHVLFFTVSAFAVIIAVNLTMAYKAVSTFPGLEVDNSYVASQGFNARKAAQEAVGWSMTPGYEKGRMTLAFLSPDAQRAILDGTLGPEWSTDHILRLNLPADWSKQAEILGL